jgi:hypothetical protein
MKIAGIMLGIYVGMNIYIGFIIPYWFNQDEENPKLIHISALVLAILFFS